MISKENLEKKLKHKKVKLKIKIYSQSKITNLKFKKYNKLMILKLRDQLKIIKPKLRKLNL